MCLVYLFVMLRVLRLGKYGSPKGEGAHRTTGVVDMSCGRVDIEAMSFRDQDGWQECELLL